jgi:rhamnogalacturonyl hydrolase YesR
MKRVADWQLVNPSASSNRYTEDAWTWGALYAGMMALADVSDTPKYENAMIAMGERFQWNPARRIYHADDHVVAQTYLELYLKHREPKMMQPTKERFDYILANRSANELVYERRAGTGPRAPGEPDRTEVNTKHRYWWCDALFMGPPAWARMHTVTGDKKYLQFMDEEWWAASEFLYDPQEHLYFRDSRYFTQREANGQKIFWSRGNGWVIAGLARVLDHLPRNHPTRPKYEQQFKEMAAKIASLQQEDGLWRASLLDPASYPLKETSGSGFFTFALAWGINNGFLDRATYEPVVRKGWASLVECVNADGKLEHVQPVGADPKAFDATHSDVYGVGAFLLAGREVYQLSQPKTRRLHSPRHS